MQGLTRFINNQDGIARAALQVNATDFIVADLILYDASPFGRLVPTRRILFAILRHESCLRPAST